MIEYEWPEGLKHTRQREDVIKILLDAKEPMTANDIYRKIEETDAGCNYAISTIYRTLTALEEKGCIEKSNLLGEDMAVYLLKRDSHQHFAVCLGCHKVIPLKQCPFGKIRMRQDASEEDFVITGHKLEVYGYCKECSREQE